MKSILYIGDLNQYGRGYQRYMTLKAMGYDVDGISHTYVSNPNEIVKPTFLYRIFWKLRFPIDDMKVNSQVVTRLKQRKYDAVWIEKGNMMKPWVLKKIKALNPKAVLISCSEDDMYVKHGYSLWYKLGLRHYDQVFTTKAYNVTELREFGAKKVTLFLDSYSEYLHHPFSLKPEEKSLYGCEVSAIGAFEPERAQSVLFLAEKGIQVHVWGGLWQQWVKKHPNLIVHNKFLFGEEYAKTICATKINLNFLRKINRDEVTSRSVEIPACGGFMITERTQRHSEFFKEGEEAEFFSSNEELYEKVIYYLQNESRRLKIAKAGYERCLNSGYSMRSQLKFILDKSNI